MSLTLVGFFNLRLAHIAPLGYQKTVAFTQPQWNVPPTPRLVRPEKRRFVVGPGIWASAAKRKKPQSLSSVSAKSSVAERSAIEEWRDPARTQLSMFADRIWES